MAAESGSHSPLGDRQARLPGGERANIRAKREIPGTWCNSIAIRSKVCYNIFDASVKWQKGGEEMKKFLYSILYSVCGILSLIYITFFCLNVSELVTKHMDYEVFVPIYVMIFAVLLSVVMLIINKTKTIDKKLFVIPLVFFISATITLFIGCSTPCEFCTL